MNPTPSDYIDDACRILGVERGRAFIKPLSSSKQNVADRTRVMQLARRLAFEDGHQFLEKEWIGDSGMGVHAIRTYRNAPPLTCARTGNIEDVIVAACRVCGVLPSSLGTTCRHPDVVRARMLISVSARVCTDRSYPEIARAMGRHAHSSLIEAVQRYDRLTADGQCPELTELLDKILAACGTAQEVAA